MYIKAKTKLYLLLRFSQFVYLQQSHGIKSTWSKFYSIQVMMSFFL